MNPTEEEIEEEVEDVVDVEDSPEVNEAAEETQREEEQPSAVDQSALVEAIRAAMPQPQAKAEPEPQMSPEEQARLLRHFSPDQRLTQALFDPDTSPEERTALLQDFTRKTVEHAAAIAAQMASRVQQDVLGQVQPIQAEIQTARAERFKAKVLKDYPVFKGKEQLLELAAQSLQTQGYRPASEADAIKRVAGEAERLAKSVNPSFSLKTMPKMAAVSTGGGQKAAKPEPKSKAKPWTSIFN